MSELAKKLKIKKNNTTEEIKLYSSLLDIMVGGGAKHGLLDLKVDDINCYAPLNLPSENNTSNLTIKKDNTELKVNKTLLTEAVKIKVTAYRNDETLIQEFSDIEVPVNIPFTFNNSNVPSIDGYDFVMSDLGPNIIFDSGSEGFPVKLYYIPNSVLDRTKTNWNEYFFSDYPGSNTLPGTNLWNQDVINTYNSKSFNLTFCQQAKMTTPPKLNTSNCTDFGSMFSYCSGMININYPYDTSNGITFASMFNGCSSLLYIPLLNTENGEDFDQFLAGCSSITSLPGFNLSKAKDCFRAFSGMGSLINIDPIDTSNIENFSQMFQNDYSLKTIYWEIDLSSATNIDYMFRFTTVTGIKFKNVPRNLDFTNIGIDESAYTILNYID